MEPVSVWVIAAIWVTTQGVSPEMSPDAYGSKEDCEKAIIEVKEFVKQQGALKAYGLSCVKIDVKENDYQGPKGKGRPIKI